MLASPTQTAALPAPQTSASGQLRFNWDQPATVAVSASNAAVQTEEVSPQPFTIDGPTERRVRKMKRISIGREPRPIPGGEAWESPEELTPAPQPKSRLSRSTTSRPSLAVETAKRFSEPVRIGAAMLNLLRSYGISEEEIAAGIASYANANCQAVAS